MDTVQYGQKYLSQPEQVTKVIETEVDKISCQVHHLRETAE